MDTFSSGWTGTKRCSTCASSSALGAASQRTGSWCTRWASSPTAESRVAEKNIVCRLAWNVADDPVDLWLEAHVEHPVGLVENEGPTASSDTALRSSRSLRRPGVATRTSAVALASSAPPRDAAIDRRDLDARGASDVISTATWEASSRVGTSTTAAGRDRRSRPSTMGIAKASVFPDPVGALARTSRPASASREPAWTGRGCGCRARRGRTIRAGTPRSEKDCCISIHSSVVRSRSVCLDPWRNRRSQTSQDDGAVRSCSVAAGLPASLH